MTGSALDVAVMQLAVADGDSAANVERAAERIRATPGAGLYLLPELWTTGYARSEWAGAADRDTPRALRTLAELARAAGAFLGGSMISRADDGALVNRFWLLGPDGAVAATYDKTHLFPPMAEPEHLEAGTRRVRTAVAGFSAGLSLCYDLRFPEMYRLDALDGADLFLIPAEWPAERIATMRLLARARAAENQAYAVLCNRAGPAGDGTVFGGGSLVVGPDGTTLADAGTGEETIRATLDPATVRAVRARLPVFEQRAAGVDWL